MTASVVGPRPNELLEYALKYASYGWPVFPLAPKKKIPLISKEKGGHGVLDATTDEARIRSWWRKCPRANIGVACGDKARQPFVLIDIDPRHGGTPNSFQKLVGEKVPPTKCSRTGSGGIHMIFLVPAGYDRSKLQNDVEKLGPGLDHRWNGGYFVAPPSIHENGRRYQWMPDHGGIATAPVALLKLLEKRKKLARWQDADLLGDTIIEGSRDTTIFKMLCKWRNDGYSRDELLAIARAVNAQRCVPPLEDEILVAKVDSAMKYRPTHPDPTKVDSTTSGTRGAKRKKTPAPDDYVPPVRDGQVPEALFHPECEVAMMGILLGDLAHNTDLRSGLLGLACSLLTIEDFYDYRVRIFMRAMVELDYRQGYFSVASLLVEAKTMAAAETDKPAWDVVATFQDWLDVTDDFTDRHVRDLAERIKDASKRRRRVALARRLAEANSLSDAATDEEVNELIAKIQAVGEETTEVHGDFSESIDLWLKRLAEWRSKPGQIKGVSTGLRLLDEALGVGLLPGDLITVAARSSMGKTAFMQRLLLSRAKQCPPGHAVAFISLEMTRQALVSRFISMETGLSTTEIMRGYTDDGVPIDEEKLLAKAEEMRSLPIFIVDAQLVTRRMNGSRGVMTVDDVRARLHQWERARDVRFDLVVVDFLELVKVADDRRRDPRDQQLGDIALNLKYLALDLDLPVVIASQLNRESENSPDHLPSIAHIKGSDQVLSYSDVVILLFRKKYYTDRLGGVDNIADGTDSPPGVVNIIIGKHRNGKVSHILGFLREKTTGYYDYDPVLKRPVEYDGSPCAWYVSPDGFVAPSNMGISVPNRTGSRPLRVVDADAPSRGALSVGKDWREPAWVPAALPYPEDDFGDVDDSP